MLFQSTDEVYKQMKAELAKAQNHLDEEFASLRAGRANPKILDKIMVNYYGSMTPLNQMANITVPDPRSLLVNIWDQSALKEVEKAILESNLGLTPSNDGRAIRLVFPVPTEERRRELAKQAKAVSEDTKVAMRNARRDAIDAVKAMKKENLLTEDGEAMAEKEIQKILDNATKQVEEQLAKKEKEIMEV